MRGVLLNVVSFFFGFPMLTCEEMSIFPKHYNEVRKSNGESWLMDIGTEIFSGVMRETVKVALSAGSSKHGKASLASVGSICVENIH